jgi:hypothetical protein
MLVPLHAFVRGDTLGLLILAQDDDTVERLTQRTLDAAAPRVARSRGMSVYFGGKRLHAGSTVAQAGLTALDRIDLIPEGEHA